MRSLNDSLPGRMLTVLFATLAASGLAYLIYRGNQAIQPAVLKAALMGGIGFSAGFAARSFLVERTFLLRLLTALLAILAGLVLLGLVSGGLLGASMPRTDQQTLNLDWIAEFGLASLAALLSLSAWKVSSPAKAGNKNRLFRRIPAGAPGSKKTMSDVRKTGAAGKTGTQNARVQKGGGGLQREVLTERWKQAQNRLRIRLRRWWKDGIPDAPIGGRGAPSQPAAPSRTKPGRKSAAKPAASKASTGTKQAGSTTARSKSRKSKAGTRRSIWSPGRAQMKRVRRIVQPRSARTDPETSNAIRLIGKEEHRCPFCLEEVVPGDSRGVKICPICHTHHHADCWAVTGTCQVPHYHE